MNDPRRQVGGRSAKFSTAQRQSQENPPTAENSPPLDPLLEDIASGLPFRAPGPSEFEIRDALNTRLAVVDAELRRLSGAVERLTELIHKKLTAKPPRAKSSRRAPKRKAVRKK